MIIIENAPSNVLKIDRQISMKTKSPDKEENLVFDVCVITLRLNNV